MITLIALQQQVAILFLLIKSKYCFYLYVKWQYHLPLSGEFHVARAKPTRCGIKNAGIVGFTDAGCTVNGTALARLQVKKASSMRRHA